jgi:Phytanoyl-CoA dioxygenase (PhyH)
MMRVLTSFDFESFVERGFCMLRAAFAPQDAAAAVDCLWQRIEQKTSIRRADPATWPDSYDIEEQLPHPRVIACFNDRVAAAIEQLVGPDRWCGDRRWGFWPVNFSYGAGAQRNYPTHGWHVDGNWFRHTIDCPKQGLLVIGLFTDIQPRWGGTIVAGGSHKLTARVLANYPEGISHIDLFQEVLREPLGDFHEITGNAGDVVFCHPFLFHCRGYKHGGPPRIISNTEAGLSQPMNLRRPNPDDQSPLERSIIQALAEEPVVSKDARLCVF